MAMPEMDRHEPGSGARGAKDAEQVDHGGKRAGPRRRSMRPSRSWHWPCRQRRRSEPAPRTAPDSGSCSDARAWRGRRSPSVYRHVFPLSRPEWSARRFKLAAAAAISSWTKVEHHRHQEIGQIRESLRVSPWATWCRNRRSPASPRPGKTI